MNNPFYDFFLIVLPGFEDIALKELNLFLKYQTCEPYPEITILEGGIKINCPLKFGCELNKYLKTPSRILLRIDEFKCKDAPKLFNKISKIKWNKYLTGKIFEVEVSTKESRLFDSRKIEKAVIDGVNLFIDSNPLKKKYIELNAKSPLAKIYIRIVNDLCSISIDTSSEGLYKRGLKTHTGHAPIRETFASALLYKLIEPLEQVDSLIDPMCGSGTFLIEAFNLTFPNNNRKYFFEFMPLYLEDKTIINLNSIPRIFSKNLFGYDLDPEIIKLTKLNLEQLNIADQINVSVADLFKEEHNNEVHYAIINPPYGIRVDSNKEINSHFFNQIIEISFKKFKLKKLGIIVPSDFNLTINYKIISTTKFKNGGIPVIFYVLGTK